MIGSFISGRLGNQFFQYAFARTLRHMRGDTEELLFNFNNVTGLGSIKDGFEDSLKYFNVLPYRSTTKDLIMEYGNLCQSFMYNFFRIENKILKRNMTLQQIAKLDNIGIYLSGGGRDHMPSISMKDHIFTKGTFENPIYFKDIKSILQNEFTPKFSVRDCNKDLYNKICNTESVCITVRRGDYVSNKSNLKNFFLCDKNYFEESISRIKKILSNPTFFFFSDDIDWVKDNITIDCPCFYESGSDPIWEKVRLMYSCKHFIISNSTFSWWAQYLSRNDKKIVISPDKWFSNDNWKSFLVMDNFIKIHV